MGRVAKVECLIMALRECDLAYLRHFTTWEKLGVEFNHIVHAGSAVDEVLKAIADLIEEVIEGES